MTSSVRLDLWPAEVVSDPDTPHARRSYPVRVVVTLDEVLVFEDGPRRPALVFRDRLASFSRAVPAHRATKAERLEGSHRFHVATTDSGHALAFARASGCGCGSKLKALSLRSLLALDAAPSDAMPSAASVADL